MFVKNVIAISKCKPFPLGGARDLALNRSWPVTQTIQMFLFFKLRIQGNKDLIYITLFVSYALNCELKELFNFSTDLILYFDIQFRRLGLDRSNSKTEEGKITATLLAAMPAAAIPFSASMFIYAKLLCTNGCYVITIGI